MAGVKANGSGLAADILGLGQAIVDWSSSVTDGDLAQFGVAKGGRRVIGVEERAEIMASLDEIGAQSQVSAGGSLANTLVGVARLSRAAGKNLRVALGGSLGTDTLGQFFNSQMRSAGVRCLLDHHYDLHASSSASQQQKLPSQQQVEQQPCAPGVGSSAHTGTVMVLTTPDAQRSFLSFFTSDSLTLSERLRNAVRCSTMVVVEGYLWEMPGAEEYISAVLETASAAGVKVAMTAGDPGVVARHRDKMLRVIDRGIDMLFTNEEEAAALAGMPREGDATTVGEATLAVVDDEKGLSHGERAARALAHICPLAVVTAGSRGSYVCAMGEVHKVPAHWLPQGPVDTCGAGDAYAAGWLYAQLSGYDVRTSGEFASQVASAVIGRYGPHLSDDDAEQLVRQLPGHVSPVRVRIDLPGLGLGAGDFLDF
ncbi:hypothetical protein GPECTOR_70g499 [Gonium pectorale]|uniref:Carbohydrate kinase PfkB domain-containing protein n=1 Tax=Gonium pectorale TaxID=33097 RepID=A0A150G350_GONPE|nr:hypothetical protein GPECTOR_70g499 [Gonium pectorale]|eukprot:KXZ44268.1 hypothetical protein GPECTOR_70g499 [Gonium pectorale]